MSRPGHPGQEPVVEAAAASQAITPGVKHESRDQRPVHFRDFDLGATVAWFRNSQDTWLQVRAQRRDLEQPHAVLLALDAGAENPLACRHGMEKEGACVDLLRKGCDVKQDGMCGGIARKCRELRDQLSFFGGPNAWIKPQDRLLGRSPQRSLEMPFLVVLLHRDIPGTRNRGKGDVPTKDKPVSSLARELARAIHLHRNAVGALLRTRSSGGSLRPARNRSFKKPMLGPYGSNVGSPKGQLPIEHGRSYIGLNRTALSYLAL